MSASSSSCSSSHSLSTKRLVKLSPSPLPSSAVPSSGESSSSFLLPEEKIENLCPRYSVPVSLRISRLPPSPSLSSSFQCQHEGERIPSISSPLRLLRELEEVVKKKEKEEEGRPRDRKAKTRPRCPTSSSSLFDRKEKKEKVAEKEEAIEEEQEEEDRQSLATTETSTLSSLSSSFSLSSSIFSSSSVASPNHRHSHGKKENRTSSHSTPSFLDGSDLFSSSSSLSSFFSRGPGKVKGEKKETEEEERDRESYEKENEMVKEGKAKDEDEKKKKLRSEEREEEQERGEGLSSSLSSSQLRRLKRLQTLLKLSIISRCMENSSSSPTSFSLSPTTSSSSSSSTASSLTSSSSFSSSSSVSSCAGNPVRKCLEEVHPCFFHPRHRPLCLLFRAEREAEEEEKEEEEQGRRRGSQDDGGIQGEERDPHVEKEGKHRDRPLRLSSSSLSVESLSKDRRCRASKQEKTTTHLCKPLDKREEHPSLPLSSSSSSFSSSLPLLPAGVVKVLNKIVEKERIFHLSHVYLYDTFRAQSDRRSLLLSLPSSSICSSSVSSASSCTSFLQPNRPAFLAWSFHRSPAEILKKEKEKEEDQDPRRKQIKKEKEGAKKKRIQLNSLKRERTGSSLSASEDSEEMEEVISIQEEEEEEERDNEVSMASCSSTASSSSCSSSRASIVPVSSSRDSSSSSSDFKRGKKEETLHIRQKKKLKESEETRECFSMREGERDDGNEQDSSPISDRETFQFFSYDRVVNTIPLPSSASSSSSLSSSPSIASLLHQLRLSLGSGHRDARHLSPTKLLETLELATRSRAILRILQEYPSSFAADEENKNKIKKIKDRRGGEGKEGVADIKLKGKREGDRDSEEETNEEKKSKEEKEETDLLLPSAKIVLQRLREERFAEVRKTALGGHLLLP
ncbi:hypothetical protein CSUI_006049 [Cystoisospora suis]|uniref:Uncharacterized protein n=1 Tax=Cystoisospora suis TaxID=483139 RepID=A0A2C6KHZ3_9APIC|nr:hypothetical protein CSUI_006049 [Cystoisospora suis]